MARDTESKTLKTTTTSINILELVEEMDGARVSELAKRTDTPKSTVHGHLATLRSKEFVVKQGDIYYLGPELLRLGSQIRTQEEEYILARGFTEKLFDQVGFRSTFAAEMGGKAVFIHSASGNKLGWAHERMGNRLYLHNTAVGKAILAELPRPRVTQIIDKWGMPEETNRTITDREELFEELTAIRNQGYAVNRGENIEDLHAIGVAATEQSGDTLGAFSITGPRHSITGKNREEQLGEAIIEVVEEFELEYSLSRGPSPDMDPR